jgi:hypothetical protein
MHDGWRGKLILHTTSFKLASSSGDYVPNHSLSRPIGQRNQESLRRWKAFTGVRGEEDKIQ